jgi:hypothetical protein
MSKMADENIRSADIERPPTGVWRVMHFHPSISAAFLVPNHHSQAARCSRTTHTNPCCDVQLSYKMSDRSHYPVPRNSGWNRFDHPATSGAAGL